jgi:hypothetical protein
LSDEFLKLLYRERKFSVSSVSIATILCITYFQTIVGSARIAGGQSFHFSAQATTTLFLSVPKILARSYAHCTAVANAHPSASIVF